MDIIAPDRLGPEWIKALRLYQTVLVQSLRGTEPPLTEPYAALQAQLRSLLKTDMITCGLWMQFERWAKVQLGWHESSLPNMAGLVPPGFEAYCRQQDDLRQQLRESDVSELRSMETLSVAGKQYVSELTATLAALTL